MDRGSVEKALDRIEAAVARIEQALAQNEGGVGDLRERHERLKTAVAHSLDRLDQVVGARK